MNAASATATALAALRLRSSSLGGVFGAYLAIIIGRSSYRFRLIL
jgi:hypothetical protein